MCFEERREHTHTNVMQPVLSRGVAMVMGFQSFGPKKSGITFTRSTRHTHNDGVSRRTVSLCVCVYRSTGERGGFGVGGFDILLLFG